MSKEYKFINQHPKMTTTQQSPKVLTNQEKDSSLSFTFCTWLLFWWQLSSNDVQNKTVIFLQEYCQRLKYLLNSGCCLSSRNLQWVKYTALLHYVGKILLQKMWCKAWQGDGLYYLQPNNFCFTAFLYIWKSYIKLA